MTYTYKLVILDKKENMENKSRQCGPIYKESSLL